MVWNVKHTVYKNFKLTWKGLNIENGFPGLQTILRGEGMKFMCLSKENRNCRNR
jgi:hypothetical protein